MVTRGTAPGSEKLTRRTPAPCKGTINPDYAIAYELHELTQIKPIKCIGNKMHWIVYG